MTPKTLRLIAIILAVAAAVVAVLNLNRVAGLGLRWLPPILVVLGGVFMILALRKSR